MVTVSAIATGPASGNRAVAELRQWLQQCATRGASYRHLGVDGGSPKSPCIQVSSPAEAFLKAFRDAIPKGAALETIAADATGFAAALAEHPEALNLAMKAAGNSVEGPASVASGAFAAGACRRDGRIVASDQAFAAFDLPRRAIAEALRVADSGAPRLSAIVDDALGRPVAVAVARPERALLWPLGDEVRAALTSSAADFGILCVRSAEAIDWPALFQAWAFSRAQTTLASALVRHADLRCAAKAAGVSYETARETLAAAMAKTGARRQPEFVSQLAQLAYGILPADETTSRTLADTYDLSARQAQLALLVTSGTTRSAAASALGISDQSAKAYLKVVFANCGVDGGVALGRVVAETGALARLAAATDVEILGTGVVPSAPLRFVRRRRAPGRIAVEDHGPLSGVPVVVFHTPTSGRHLPRRLVAAMHGQGLRPISLERPGFGLTSPAYGDCVEDANADLIDVMDALNLKRVRLLGRSLAMPMRFAAAHPERIERGVLIGATPPGVRTTRGLLGSFIRLALDRPHLIRAFARMAVRLSSERSILRLTERAVAGSRTDLAAIADPQNRADWIRACRQSSGDGFVREFALHANGGAIPAAAYAMDWTILIGETDALSEGVPDDPVALWRAAIPDAQFERVPAGRLLHLSHPGAVAGALADRPPEG